MALLDSEGFGWTTTYSDLVTYGAFYSASGTSSTAIVTNGPLGDNYCHLNSSFAVGQGALVRLLPTTNMTTIYTGCRYNGLGDTNNEYSGISFLDSSLACQFTVVANPTTLQIQVYRGTPWSGGTLLGSSANSVFPLTGWFYMEVYLLIASGTGGAVTVRINNAAVLTLTGQNTQATANTGAARIVLGQTGAPLGQGNGSADSGIAHWYLCDGTGSAPWNTFLGDVRVQTIVPTSNATVQFTPSIATATFTLGGQTPTGGNYGVSANQVYLIAITPTTGGSLQTGQVYVVTGYTGFAKMALYSDIGGTYGGPGTVIASTSAITNPVSGLNTFTFTTNPVLAAGTRYWAAFLSSAAVTAEYNSNYSSWGNQGFNTAMTYSGGFTTINQNYNDYARLWLSISVDPANYNMLVVPPAPTTYYNSDSTVGNQDTFNTAGTAASTSTVYGLHHKGIYLKSNAGTRSMQSVLVSGATTGTGASTPLGTSGQQVKTMFETDPNTSAQWTTTAANAAQPGYNVSA